jgi:hypothetical protein
MRIIQFLVSVLFASILNAQDVKVPAIVKRLTQESRPVNVFTYKINKLIKNDDLPESFTYAGQDITKSSKGIFLNQLGTGRIYELVTKDGVSTWQRIDSTVFYGYNFGSLFFSMDSTLYSYAGQGFFQHNGNLRYFNKESNEWDARDLSSSILWVSHTGLFYGFDTSNKQLYIEALALKQDQALKNRLVPELEDTFWKLDIRSGNWTKLGKLNKDKLVSIAETPYGTLYNFYNIADPKNNKLYKLSTELSNRIRNKLGNSTKSQDMAISYCIDSTLYLGDLEDFVDSVVISKKDLIDTGESFYTPIEKDLPIKEREVLIGLVVVLGITSSFLFYKISKRGGSQPPVLITGIGQPDDTAEEKNDKENQVVFRSGKLLDLLNERENTRLSFIY